MRYLPDGLWMQRADSYTIQSLQIPSVVLMERAALETVAVMEREQVDLSNVLIVCGSGNNGGDGFAIARLLHEKKKQVTVVFAGSESSMSRECRLQAQIAKNLGIPVFTAMPDGEYTVMIDALFGVGLNRNIEGKYAELLTQMNASGGRKIAIDIPSGIDSGSGKVLGSAFRAEMTVSFQCEKLGTVLFPGKEYAGKVAVADIGINMTPFQKNQEIAYTLETSDISRLLPKRRANSHKGTYGKVLMITGSQEMTGAAYLSAKAAYTMGAGLVQIYTAEAGRTILQQLLPEAIITSYTDYDEIQFKQLLEWADVVCIGCGLEKSRVSEQIVRAAFQYCRVPCVADADALNLLSEHMELLKEAVFPLVLTPHMKEMARLLGCTTAELIEKRFDKLAEFCSRYPAVCVLKDARTAVSAKGKAVFINTAGNSAMAKAGTGDVLAGVITGLLAQRQDPYDAAVLGVYLHAMGGDDAKKRLGSYSVLASDLIDGIRNCLREAEERGEG